MIHKDKSFFLKCIASCKDFADENECIKIKIKFKFQYDITIKMFKDYI